MSERLEISGRKSGSVKARGRRPGQIDLSGFSGVRRRAHTGLGFTGRSNGIIGGRGVSYGSLNITGSRRELYILDLVTTLTAIPGTMAFSGVQAFVSDSDTLVSGIGTMPFTGVTISISEPDSLSSGVGSMPFTGVTCTISEPDALVASVGSMAFTGITSTLEEGTDADTLTAIAGSMAFTGVTSTIATPDSLSSGVGSMPFTGVLCHIAEADTLTSGVGAMPFTGVTTTIEEGVSGDTLTALVGSMAFSGVTSTVAEPDSLQASAGSMSFSGIECTLTEPDALVSGVGSMAFTGVQLTLAEPDAIVSGIGSMAFTGIESSIGTQDALNAVVGSMAFTGIQLTIASPDSLTSTVGSMAFTGIECTIAEPDNLSATVGSMAFSGVEMTLEEGSAGGYRSDTLAHQSRIGGTLLDIDFLDALYQKMEDEGVLNNLVGGYCSVTGYLDDGSGNASVVYDISSVLNDASAGDGNTPVGSDPALTKNALLSNGVSHFDISAISLPSTGATIMVGAVMNSNLASASWIAGGSNNTHGVRPYYNGETRTTVGGTNIDTAIPVNDQLTATDEFVVAGMTRTGADTLTQYFRGVSVGSVSEAGAMTVDRLLARSQNEYDLPVMIMLFFNDGLSATQWANMESFLVTELAV